MPQWKPEPMIQVGMGYKSEASTCGAGSSTQFLVRGGALGRPRPKPDATEKDARTLR